MYLCPLMEDTCSISAVQATPCRTHHNLSRHHVKIAGETGSFSYQPVFSNFYLEEYTYGVHISAVYITWNDLSAKSTTSPHKTMTSLR